MNLHKQSGDKMDLKEETKEMSSKIMEITLGISYEEFEQLDFNEQQELIAMHRKKLNKENYDEEIVLIGSGEDSCFVKVGATPEEERQEINDYFDNIFFNKPFTMARKLK